jgi:hypothetical protein
LYLPWSRVLYDFHWQHSDLAGALGLDALSELDRGGCVDKQHLEQRAFAKAEAMRPVTRNP